MKVSELRITKIIIFALLFVGIVVSGCTQQKQLEPRPTNQKQTVIKNRVRQITSVEAFDNIIAAAGDTLLMVDLYADWCAPCRQLAPIIENIAGEKRGQVLILKVNVDHLRPLAVKYNVTGIPYVVFIRKGKLITSLTGLQNKKAYVAVIDKYAAKQTI